MLWLAISFPDLGIAVHTRSQAPGAQTHPVAIVLEGRVLGCNAEATDEGVEPGQSTSSAVALCPSLRFLEHLPKEEERLLRQIAESCIAVTPTVVLCPPHSLLLEIGSCLQLFGGHAGLLKQVRRCLRPFEMSLVLAQAPTPKAALALVASPQAQASLQLAPPVSMADCLPLLREVPLAALPWAPDQHKKLRALHFHSLGELLDLPRATLSKRLGVTSTRYLAAMLGEQPDPQVPIKVAEDFQSTLYFLDGISHAEGLRFPMKRLVEELCRFLRQRQWSCSRFYWRFTHQDKSRQQLLISSARGEPQVARFMTLSELKLESFRVTAPVESITLLAQEFQPQSDTRLSLIPDPGQEDEKAMELLDRLRARLGADACQLVSPQNTLRPEKEQRVGSESHADTEAESSKALRPFWIWPEAKAVRIMEGQLWWQGAFNLLSGPERITLPWWEDGDRRDYYLARHDNGAHYWLYYSGQSQSWFCQGMFG